MPAIAAANVTYTITSRERIGRLKTIECSIAFGDAALTYPAGGVPLTLASLGLARNIKHINISDSSNGDGFVYKWDKTNNKIRIYVQGVTLSAAGAGTPDDYPVTAGVGVSTISFSAVVAGAGTYGFGAMKEFLTSVAPSATTLKVQVVGF